MVLLFDGDSRNAGKIARRHRRSWCFIMTRGLAPTIAFGIGTGKLPNGSAPQNGVPAQICDNRRGISFLVAVYDSDGCRANSTATYLRLWYFTPCITLPTKRVDHAAILLSSAHERPAIRRSRRHDPSWRRRRLYQRHSPSTRSFEDGDPREGERQLYSHRNLGRRAHPVCGQRKNNHRKGLIPLDDHPDRQLRKITELSDCVGF
jgi:hypothetical protein